MYLLTQAYAGRNALDIAGFISNMALPTYDVDTFVSLLTGYILIFGPIFLLPFGIKFRSNEAAQREESESQGPMNR